ncbi:hypothetical protein LshimejAT787_1105230 [Lyophyllum shimeji]|uniref:DUF6699 domain-containing protein n=1 Tax=Lyophyllum shimeji TaxID=47721 RepID=A0A9P3PUY9_LYOSH|nr:hypothetical protein LshimejAT787_1105230 [Lyophyllum shimeji]
MAKGVHFAALNSSYSPVPSTPSPTLSSASLPSLSDAPTPPVNPAPMFHPRLPFEQKPSPLPSAPADEMHIHFLLAFAPFGAPAVQYNVTDPPTYLLGTQISLEAFHEPATQPPLPHLSVICPNLLSPINVISGDVGYVTVSDVLHAIHHELRSPTTTAEYKSLPMDVLKDVDAAYYNRCRRSGDEARQLQRGIKRTSGNSTFPDDRDQPKPSRPFERLTVPLPLPPCLV